MGKKEIVNSFIASLALLGVAILLISIIAISSSGFTWSKLVVLMMIATVVILLILEYKRRNKK